MKYESLAMAVAAINHQHSHYDAKLHLELAEHALLLSLGWWWSVGETNRDYRTREPGVQWNAPYGHKGSQRIYGSKAHAINSVKRHVLGFRRDFHDSDIY